MIFIASASTVCRSGSWHARRQVSTQPADGTGLPLAKPFSPCLGVAFVLSVGVLTPPCRTVQCDVKVPE